MIPRLQGRVPEELSVWSSRDGVPRDFCLRRSNQRALEREFTSRSGTAMQQKYPGLRRLIRGVVIHRSQKYNGWRCRL